MTKVAIPHWQGRVSPVFDVAANVLIVEFIDGIEQSRADVPFDIDGPHARASRLSSAEVDVLICGAISQPFQNAVLHEGIEVIPQMCGSVECVLSAYIEGRLQHGEFLMPGCCGRQRRMRAGRNCNYANKMNNQSTD